MPAPQGPGGRTMKNDDKDLRGVAKYLFTMMYPLSEWSKANTALRASFLSSAGKVLALIKPVKLRRLTDGKIKKAMKTMSSQDIMFNPEDYLEEGRAVAQAQLDLDNKAIRFTEE